MNETVTKDQIDKLITESTERYYDLPVIEIDGETYAVAVNEDEANRAAREYIESNICYFNPHFLADHSRDVPVEVFEALARAGFDNCRAYWTMIDDMHELAEEAIEVDGRGHFLNNTDGKEIEVDGYYLYQCY